VVYDDLFELTDGAVVGNWRLIRRVAGSKHESWVVVCTSCGSTVHRLADHLRIGAQPGCGKCRAKMRCNGAAVKRRIAARHGERISDLEAWAFDNCDNDPRAQQIVDQVIARETAAMRRRREAEHETLMKKGVWRRYNPSSRPADIREVTIHAEA
jgi:hypothetical protein